MTYAIGVEHVCVGVVELNPPTGVDRQHESWEARRLYPSALQLARALRLEFRWACHLTYT
jgi:hypothetical protein